MQRKEIKALGTKENSQRETEENSNEEQRRGGNCSLSSDTAKEQGHIYHSVDNQMVQLSHIR